MTLTRAPRFVLHDAQAEGGGPICPLPGTVIAVHVAAGDSVTDGQVLMVVEAMKMEHKIIAPADATVAEIRFAVGDRVDQGDLLVALDHARTWRDDDSVTEPIRIANCSGFFGDRPSGALEMVEGGPIDVLTGDWLAELTMLILSRIRAKRAKGGYARTFVSQMEQVMGTCLDKGIKVVSNAGGLDPDGCADAVQEVADRLGLSPTIAYIDGDDLMPRITELAESGALAPFGSATDLGDPTRFLTANAYLGCFGIVDALTKGADIVITGRVTDAAVTCGPAAWHHGWSRTDLDQLAGGVVAGHIIECSAQVTGGNYSFFHEIDRRNDVGGGARFGFPWADVAERRFVRDRQARRNRRGGQRRDGDLAVALRDRRTRVPRARCHGPVRHDPGRATRTRSSARVRHEGRGATIDAEGRDERTRWLSELVHRRADRARHR